MEVQLKYKKEYLRLWIFTLSYIECTLYGKITLIRYTESLTSINPIKTRRKFGPSAAIVFNQAMGIIEGAKVKSKLIFIEHTKYAHQAIACTNGTANFYCDSKISW